MDAIDLVVPHQANKNMVLDLATAAGVAADHLYFNIERVGNTSSASIPVSYTHLDVYKRQLSLWARAESATVMLVTSVCDATRPEEFLV